MNGDKRKCKVEMTFNSLLEKQKGLTPESADTGDSLGQIDSGRSQGKKRNHNIDDKRDMEKTQNLIHLICWGPGWS